MTDTTRYDAAIDAARLRYPLVPEAWVKAVIGTESSFQNIDRTWEGAVQEYSYGPMQVLESTAAALGIDRATLQTLYGSILAGTAYLAQLIGRYGLDFRAVYSAYNSGRPDGWSLSSQVRANVDRALGWLDQVNSDIYEAGAEIVGELEDAAQSVAEDPLNPAITLIAIGGVLWVASRARKRS